MLRFTAAGSAGRNREGNSIPPSAPPGAFDSDLKKPKPGCSAQGQSWPGRLTIPLVVTVPHSSDAEATVPSPILFAAKQRQGGFCVLLAAFTQAHASTFAGLLHDAYVMGMRMNNPLPEGRGALQVCTLDEPSIVR